MRKIIWVKWVDPLAPLVQTSQDEEDIEQTSAKDSFRDQDDEPMKIDTGPTLVGPVGIVPLHENNLPSRLFNFWMGHTNFDITQNVVDAIIQVPGVETLDIFTRYRFRIAFGKAFNANAVMKEIDCLFKEQVKNDKLELIKRTLQKKYRHWAIYQFPDGRTETVGADTIEEVKELVKPFEDSAYITTSW